MQSRIQLRNQTAIDVSNKSASNILIIMARNKKEKSTRVNCDWKKLKKVNAPISLKDLMVEELPLLLKEGDMRKMSVRTDPTNEDSTRIKRKKPHFESSKKPYRGSTRKAHDCPGLNWEQHFNETHQVPIYPNLPT